MLKGYPVGIIYKNWKDEVGYRIIHPIDVWYGKTEWHPEEQWFLHALDVEKNESRNFAMKDVMAWDVAINESPLMDSAPIL